MIVGLLVRVFEHLGYLFTAFLMGVFLLLLVLPVTGGFATVLFHSIAVAGAGVALFSPWSKVQLGDNRASDVRRLTNAFLWLVGYYGGFLWAIIGLG